MRKFPGFTCFLLTVHFQILLAATTTYNYSFSPLSKTDNNGFKVCIDFRSFTEKSTFDFPVVWGGNEGKEYIQLDSITGINNYSLKKGEPDKLELDHKKGSRVRIYYTIKNTVEGKMFEGRDSFFPLIKKDHFYFFSNSVMIVPSAPDLCNFRITWKDYPYANLPVTSLGTGLIQELKNIKPLDFQNLAIAGGDFKVYDKKPGKNENIKLAIRGNWSFADTSMLNMIFNTIYHQRLFWNDHSTPEYLVVMVPVLPASEHDMSFQGTGLLNSFSVAVTENKNAQPATLAYLFHHELMHHWIGSKIQNAKDEELSYWFSEGFTDYFARLNMYNCGLMNKGEYIHSLDSLFALHYSNPLRESHNDSIKVHFWDNRMFEKLPYDRGALFAYYLDLLVQNKTNGEKSLKNVMQNMLKKALKNPQPFDTAWFTREVKNISGENISSEIKRFMIRGQFIPAEMWNHVSPGLVALKQVKVYDLGFEVNTGEISKGSVVTSIKPFTGAEAGGLLKGDVLEGFSIYYGMPDHEVELDVVRNGASMRITFYPYALANVPQHVQH